MHTHIEKTRQLKNTAPPKALSNNTTFKDNRPESLLQRKIQHMSNANSTSIAQLQSKSSNQVIQLGKDDKPFFVPGPGKGFIPFMGAQFNPAYRNPEHAKLLQELDGQCPVKTFHQENHFASQFPYEGSKSKLGDAGIWAHQKYAGFRSFF